MSDTIASGDVLYVCPVCRGVGRTMDDEIGMPRPMPAEWTSDGSATAYPIGSQWCKRCGGHGMVRQ